MRRSTVLFVLPCRDRARVTAIVDAWGSDGEALGLPGMPGLHFASVTLSNPTPGFRDLLLIECCFDGSAGALQKALLASPGRARALHEALRSCRGYLPRSYRGAFARWYLWRHRRSPSLCQIGTRQLTAKEIEDESRLRTELDSFLDRALPADPLLVHRAAQAAFEITPTARRIIPSYEGGVLTWRPAPSRWIERLHRYIELGRALWPAWLLLALAIYAGRAAAAGNAWKGAVIGAATFVLPLAAAFVLTRVTALQPKDDPAYTPTPGDVIERAQRQEDRFIQNHLPSIVTLRSGLPGRLRLWLIFLGVRLFKFDTAFAESGRVFGLDHIHCSHWTLLDRGRRLLFMGNYDGSYGLYLQDFATEIGSGVREFWGGGHGYPGPDVAKFQRWGRASQLQHRVWYGAYRNLSLVNIENNHAICRGLARPLDARAAADWLRRFDVVGEREMGV